MTRTVASACLATVLWLCASGNALAQVTETEGAWTTYSGDNTGQRHSPLTQITPANVSQLMVQWLFQTGVAGGSRRRRSSSTA